MERMVQPELSKEREAELKIHLQTKLMVKLMPQQLKKIVKTVNLIRTGQISVHDYLPRYEGLIKYSDFCESLDVVEFLVL